ncbi:MAG: hypothetical protein WC766_06445 [Patescibacteria group bacterium]|jgi:hypothetical protein
MPAAVALAIRAIIQFAITLGLSELAVRYILVPLNSAIASIMEYFGVSEETATDIMANEFLVFIEQVGIGAATVRSKLPIAIADRLGFTSKGWGKRIIKKTPAVAGKPALQTAGTIAPAVNKVVESAPVTLTAERIALIRAEQATARPPTTTIAERTTLFKQDMTKLVAQMEIDERAAGAKIAPTTIKKFQEFMNKSGGYPALMALGIGVWALSEVNKIINKKGVIVYSTADGESDVIVAEEGKTAVSISQYVPSSGSTGGTTTPAVTSTNSQIKVFTGIISAGTLGTPAAFVPRQDDLISSGEELSDAARNNLASWLTGLLGRIIYEIKIVPSVVTKDGITIRGTTQRVVSSYTTKGTARYKNVVNKFAVMSMYILNDKGTRTKLAQITLGPTDATTFRPTDADLSGATANVQESITTTNIKDINTITSSAPISVTPPASVPAAAPVVITPSATPVQMPAQTAQTAPAPAPTIAQVPAPAPAPAPTKPNFCFAGTLFDFYQAKGLDLPGISSRALVYEGLGLGQASMYTGTAEQNTRLLAAQKIRYGC